MKKLFLIKNPCLFQGEKYFKTNKNYFEGWYFKTTNNKKGISFIPGINLNKQHKKAFIQVITDNSSYYVNYPIDEFIFNHKPFYIKIGNNYFSKDKIHIDIKDKKQNLIVFGDIEYAEGINIKSNIMGPFSYIAFMECNHAIISMKSKANGLITINNTNINFHNDIGYIEKDWGTSFPKTYIWCQANNFPNSNASFMISVADIPFKFFYFKGIICSLMINNKEYRFATYNNTKLKKYVVDANTINITLTKGKYSINVKSKPTTGLKLIAPVKGHMNKDIIESITTEVDIVLKKRNKIIFRGTSKNCGLEIVHK